MTDASEFDPVPAKGVGAEYFDEPALFYLTHQATIEEWHALGATVVAAVGEWISTTIGGALLSLADERGLLLADRFVDESWDHLMLHPPDMPLLGSGPAVGFGVAWPKGRVNPISNKPWVCVRYSPEDPGPRAAVALLDTGGREFRAANGFGGSDGSRWPIRWEVPAAERWWSDLDAYRDAIIAEVRRGLGGLSTPLAAAVRLANSAQPVDEGRDATPGLNG